MKPTRSAGAIDFENEPIWMTFCDSAHGVKRGRALAAPGQIGITVVLEDRHAIGLGQRQQLLAAFEAEDRAGRVLYGRDGVDEFRPRAFGFEIGERRLQRIHPHAVLVERNADDIDAEPLVAVERALVAVALADQRVAAREQRAVHEIERLQRARGEEDVVEGGFDAGVARELFGEEFAQRLVALRSAVEAVGRKRTALAREHGLRRRRQVFDRDAVRIVVAADEVVARQARPFGGRRRRTGGNERIEIERHKASLRRYFAAVTMISTL